jgi:hypothetical protein
MKDMQEQLEEMERKVRRIAEGHMQDIIEEIIEDAEWKEI